MLSSTYLLWLLRIFNDPVERVESFLGFGFDKLVQWMEGGGGFRSDEMLTLYDMLYECVTVSSSFIYSPC